MKRTLGKQERLKSRKLIGKLFEEGTSIKIFPLRMVYLKSDPTSKFPIQASFSVPKRNFKKAVDRNQVKRLLREAYRLEKEILYNDLETPYVFMITFIDKKKPLFSDVQQKIRELLTLFIQKQIQKEDAQS
ncbi:MAG: ribonuclease P protein component [Flavobacteriaceae bacterium]|jgi:ribonuclease P protein component